MKILVDIIKITQTWDPNTNEQANVLTLQIGTKQIQVPVNESIIQELVRRAKDPSERQLPPEAAERGDGEPGVLDDEIEAELQGGGDEPVFGGDYDENAPVDPPHTFVPDPEDISLDEPDAPTEPLAEETPPKPVVPPKVKLPLVMRGKILTAAQEKGLTVAQRQRLEAEMQRRHDAKDPAYLRIVKHEELRRRAARVPQRTVSSDETGAPAESRPSGGGSVGRIAAPEVEVHQPGNRDIPAGGTDDDGFAQG